MISCDLIRCLFRISSIRTDIDRLIFRLDFRTLGEAVLAAVSTRSLQSSIETDTACAAAKACRSATGTLDVVEALYQALALIGAFDGDLVGIVLLSLRVSLTAVAVAALAGLPLGAFLATHHFPGRSAILVLVNTLMGLPPVVVGLAVYLWLSASGPFGALQLLYTPAAMIIAQTILVAPILIALTCQIVTDLDAELSEQLRIFGLSRRQRIATLLFEGRAALTTALLAGFGRAIAEVGAVLIVGGNINHVTRTMTTAIALETSKGELALAMALGIILLMIAGLINAGAMALRGGSAWALSTGRV